MLRIVGNTNNEHMIYITQVIFIKEGKEEAFQEFESFAIPLMEKYGGKMIYRIRPNAESIISDSQEVPYEIHFISFESETALNNFLSNEGRKKLIHLKEYAIKSTIVVKGVEM